ncbi:MAG: endopeptidase La [Clostridia bacterium]|nr:endopeptidase La [Clostridia bacterium]
MEKILSIKPSAAILKSIKLSPQYKMIALKGVVAFPDMPVTCDIGKESSKRAIKEALETGEQIFLTTQKNLSVISPTINDISLVGTICDIRQAIKSGADVIKLLAHGSKRAIIKRIIEEMPYFLVEVEEAQVFNVDTVVTKALFVNAKERFLQYASIDNKISGDVLAFINSIENANMFIDSVAALVIKHEKKQLEILEEFDTENRLKKLINFLIEETEVAKINKKINFNIRTNMDKAQKDYYLREQMKAISAELGDEEDEYAVLEQKLISLKMPKEAKEKSLKELSRVKKMPVAAPENAIIRNYLDVIVELPWNKKTKDNKNLVKARQILDEDHAGLKDVKERIIEHLAVMQLTDKISGQIICFVGPPGVGKTSVAKSIARALGRNFVKMALGGVKDESELRGHRKTYVGAMPGRIIYNMKLAGSGNPVFLIDEIDKMASDHKGDPASAMLEILDPEQNQIFRDNFLEVPYDLSDVMFIATANNMQEIPRPLLDRMEVIELSSYTSNEKMDIAKNYLLLKESKKHGLHKGQIIITDEAMQKIIDSYTYEAGVRNLERQIAKICRKVAVKLVSEEKEKRNKIKYEINVSNLYEYLGAVKLIRSIRRKKDEVGLVTALSYSSVGGDILTIETNTTSGDGKILLTGSLGEVMKESASAALSAVKSLASDFNIDNKDFKEKDIHIHVPEGAVKKEGPSAGAALATAILSSFTGREVDANLAMTGEITIRGNVLAIGGVKEKIYAAKRAGVEKVLVPEQNREDVNELSKEVTDNMQIIFVNNLKEVAMHALKG